MSAIALFFTGISVKLAQDALKASNESLQLTKEAMAGSGIKDSIIIEIAKRTSIATDSNAQYTKNIVSTYEKYTDIFRQSMESQNRAYINTLPVDVIYNPELQQMNIVWNYKNFGKTPAYHLRKVGYIIMQDRFFSPQELEVDSLGEIAIVLAADEEGSLVRNTIPLTKSQFGDIQRGDMKAFLVACIEYKDVFGKDHFTHSYLVYSTEYKAFVYNAPYDYNDSN